MIMKASVVIPVYNNWHFTRGCLESLCDIAGSEEVEVIVVDDRSSDETQSQLPVEFPWARVVRNVRNLGFAGSCNRGAAEARGRYIVFLNNDVKTHPGWLEQMAAVPDERPDVGLVAAKLLYPDGTIQHAGVVFDEGLTGYHIYLGYGGDFPPANIAREYAVVTAACLLVRAALFRELGGFDEGYFNGFEDFDLCLAARQRGWKVWYEPGAVITHFESKTVESLPPVHCQRNAARFFRKWRGKLSCDEGRYYREDGFPEAVFPLLRGLFRGDGCEMLIRKWRVGVGAASEVRAALEEYRIGASKYGVDVEIVESPDESAEGILREGAGCTEERISLDARPEGGSLRAWSLAGGRLRAGKRYGDRGEPLFFQVAQACRDLHDSLFAGYESSVRQHLSLNRGGEARAIAEELVKFFPHNPASWKALGDADPERADEAYRAALKLDGGNTHVAVALGDLLLSRGDFAGARQCVERLLRLKPFIMPARFIQLKAALGLRGAAR
jgi:GT2 family glycosyltransferase